MAYDIENEKMANFRRIKYPLNRPIRLLQKINLNNNPNIIHLKKYFTHGKNHCLVTENIGNKTLQMLLTQKKTLSEF